MDRGSVPYAVWKDWTNSRYEWTRERKSEQIDQLTNKQFTSDSTNKCKLSKPIVHNDNLRYFPPKKLQFKDLTISIIATQCKQVKQSSGGKQSACRVCFQILLKPSIFLKIPARKQQHENSCQGSCNFERICKYHS